MAAIPKPTCVTQWCLDISYLFLQVLNSHIDGLVQQRRISSALAME